MERMILISGALTTISMVLTIAFIGIFKTLFFITFTAISLWFFITLLFIGSYQHLKKQSYNNIDLN